MLCATVDDISLGAATAIPAVCGGAKSIVLVYVLLENVCVVKINYVIMFLPLFVCQH